MSKQRFVIVGASLAGAKAAQELRDHGFDGDIALIGSEAELAYERPPLTKDYLHGESERQKAYVQRAEFYDENDIELLIATTVTGLDARGSRVILHDGRELVYDRLLLTTGAEPTRISVPGSDLDGIQYLRHLADCDAIRALLQPGARLTVIGAGWIGTEVAASARQAGLEVTVIDPILLPYERILGREIGEFYRDVHVQHGVAMLLGQGVEAFEGDGSVRSVRTSDGSNIECDFAVVAVGVVPRTDLAHQAGLKLDNGIVVNEHLVSSAPRIFAAGDVANAWHPFYEQQIRVEHWSNALHRGLAAARSMLGEEAGYARLPYFFSDQYDVGMEYSGYTTDWDQVVFRGNRTGGEFIAFWLRAGQVVAGMNVNVWDVNDKVQALIRSRHPVDLAALQDSDTPLESLVGDRGGK